jgi:hypothetical protein
MVMLTNEALPEDWAALFAAMPETPAFPGFRFGIAVAVTSEHP